MSVPKFTMRQLLENGVHFGHNTRRWNPKMEPFIFGERNNIHIIDLQKTLPLLYGALKTLRSIAAQGGKVLFVGTKRQASSRIREAAEACGQFYVDHRWLGGMLTNWNTISQSIKRLEENEALLAQGEESGLTKKELLMVQRDVDKLERSLGGIREMGGLPQAIFVIDTNKEDIAIKEAKILDIPIFAVIDTNCDPEGIDYPIPGNDDSLKAIDFYCDLVTQTVLDGVKEELAQAGVAVDKSGEPIKSKKQTKEVKSSAKSEKKDDKSKKSDTKDKETKDKTSDDKPAVKVEKKKTKRAQKPTKETAKKSDDKADAKKAESEETKAEKKTA